MIRLAFSSCNNAGHFEDSELKPQLSPQHLALLSGHVQQNRVASRENGVYGAPGAKTIFGLGEDLNGFGDDPLVCDQYAYFCACELCLRHEARIVKDFVHLAGQADPRPQN